MTCFCTPTRIDPRCPLHSATLTDKRPVIMHTLEEVLNALQRIKERGFDLDHGSVLEDMTVREIIELSWGGKR